MLCVVPNACGSARLGLVIPKKYIRLAVTRNQIKRCVRESFRVQNLPGVDIVFVAYKGSAELPRQVLREQLGAQWKRLNDWYDKQ